VQKDATSSVAAVLLVVTLLLADFVTFNQIDGYPA
jgi:hypothetical protein